MTVRVLVVDDHPIFRDGLRTALEDEVGLEVTTADGAGTTVRARLPLATR